jgi:hypothetical protein
MPSLDQPIAPENTAASPHLQSISPPSDPLWAQWILLAAQALSIIASAAEVRIWFQQPLPAGGFALTQMLAVQLMMAAALAPVLLASGRSLVMAAAPMFLFDCLAAWLSGDGSAIFAGRWALGFCWMVCGWLWISQWRVHRGIAAAILQCVVLAPPILLYLASDWGDPNRLLPWLNQTPLAVFDRAVDPTAWAAPAIIAAAFVSARLIRSATNLNKLSPT